MCMKPGPSLQGLLTLMFIDTELLEGIAVYNCSFTSEGYFR